MVYPTQKKCVSEREPDEEGSSSPLAQTASSNQLLITDKREKKRIVWSPDSKPKRIVWLWSKL
jgi:hypothetical protein